MNKNFVRIIPRLDIKNGNLIKGINLEGLRILGDPYNFSKLYCELGADEICYSDNVATLYGTNNLEKFISKTAKNLFIPLSVGGGIKSLKDVERMLKAGADKVIINSAAIDNIKFIKEASRVFGSSTIIAAIETINYNKKYYVLKSNGRDLTNRKILDWATKLQDFGAGELILTSINKDGLKEGFDISITKKISKKLTIPVIAHGGCGKIGHVLDLIKKTNISGVIIASYLHYYYFSKFKKKKFNLGNTSFYDQAKKQKKFDNLILNLKRELKINNLNVRI
tara:strand:- start:17605 stop:18447 length:843 start_codon:yes stop_codon:yes gene_type:complete